MATYGLKYLCEYRSDLRDRLLYRIEIEERDAVAATDATAIKMRPYSDVFSIKWGNADDPEYTAVKGSSVTLKILCVNDMEYLSLFTTDPRKYRMTIYEYRDDGNSGPAKRMLWRGFMSANTYKEEFARPPYVVTLSATDGLSLLSAIPFRDEGGTKFTGIVSCYDLLTAAIQALDLDMPLCEWINIVEADSGVSTLKMVYIDRALIYNVNGDPTWRDILEICTQSFIGQIFQAAGVFHVRGIMALRRPVRPAAFYNYLSNRASVLDFWKNKCDVNSNTELGLLAPYKAAIVNVNTSKVDNTAKYYNRSQWPVAMDNLRVWTFPDRIAFYATSRGIINFIFPESIAAAEKVDITISLEIYNRNSANKLNIASAAFVSVGGRFAGAPDAKKYRWSVDSKIWEESNTIPNNSTIIDPSPNANLNPHVNTDGLSSKVIKFYITSLPPNNNNEFYALSVGLFVAYDGHSTAPIECTIANVSFSFGAPVSQSSIGEDRLLIAKNGADDISWQIPIRDGGYNVNALSVLSNVLVDANNAPVVSWLAATDRGALMNVITDNIRQLRSNVVRQLSGELRCSHAIDLNSLFYDGKFTKAVYYLNSLELLASRQVYKIQLRELIDIKRITPVGELCRIHTFSDNVKLQCSLHGSLFLRTGSGPYGIELYDSETGTIMQLPYNSPKIDIRKGLNAIVIQVGDSDLYALDNFGGVLSHQTADAGGVLKYDTALYDADRAIWVSYDANPSATKTIITVFTDNMELESQDEFDIVAQGLSLISNGYIIHGDAFTTYWHNYELHSSGSLLAVTDSYDPMSVSQFDTMAVSDSLLVKRYMSRQFVFAEMRRRNGTQFRADDLLHTFGVFGSTPIVAKCNCAIAAILMQYSDRTELEIYDARNNRRYSMSVAPNAEIAVCGPRVFVLVGSALHCVSLDDHVMVSDDSVEYYLWLNGEDTDQSNVNVPSDGMVIPYRVESNGTTYIISKDDDLSASFVDNPDGARMLSITVPKNNTPYGRLYHPVIIGVREDNDVRHSIGIYQEAMVTGYYLTINGQTEDVEITCDSKAQSLTFAYKTNGTIMTDFMGGDGVSGISWRDGIITILLDRNPMSIPWIRDIRFGVTEDSSVRRHIIIKQEVAGTRMIIIDTSSVGDLSGMDITLMFELDNDGATGEDTFTIEDNRFIRLSFDQVATVLRVSNLADYEGDSLYIEASQDGGMCDRATIPTNGDMQFVLV